MFGELKTKKYNFIEILFVIGFTIILSLTIYNSDFIIDKASIGGDVGVGHYAIWSINARIWASKEVPLWNSYIWGGYNDVGQIHGVFYPILLILQKIFWQSETQTLSYGIVIAYLTVHVVLFILGMYLLCRIYSKNIILCFVVAMLAAFCPATLSTRYWMYIWGGIAWIPLLIFLLIKTVNSNKYIYSVLSGIVFSLIILGAIAQGTIMAIITYIIIFGIALLNKPLGLSNFMGLVKRFFVSGLIGAGFGSTELLSFVRTYLTGTRIIDSEDGVMSFNTFTEMKADISDLRNLFGLNTGRIGLAVIFIVLIITGITVKNQNETNENKIYYFIGTIFFAFGVLYCCSVIVPDLLYYIPFVNGVRQPILYAPFISIGGGCLAIRGIEQILNTNFREADSKYKLLTTVNCIILVVSVLPHNYNNIESRVFVLIFVLILLTSMIMRNGLIKREFLFISFILVVFANIKFYLQINEDGFFVKDACAETSLINESVEKLLGELDNQEELKNGAKILQWGQGAYPSNVSGTVGYRDCFAYLNMIYRKTMETHIMGALPLRVKLQNINYFLTNKNADDGFVEWLSAYLGKNPVESKNSTFSDYFGRDESNAYIWDMSEETLGCGWMVYNYDTYNDSDSAEDVFGRMNSQEFDIEHTVLINKKMFTNSLDINDDGTAGDFKIYDVNYKNNSVEMKVDTSKNGVLVTSDFYYPGWKVYVDGTRDEILEVDYCNRGVYLTSGTHIVKFSFLPQETIIGISLCIITLLLVIYVLYGELIICKKKNKKARKIENE